MRHHIFQESSTYSIAVLMKGTAFNKPELKINYIDPLVKHGVPENELIAFTLKYDADGKAPAKLIKEYLGNLLPALDQLGTKTLYVTDATYFKTLAGQSKADPNLGYALPCKIKGYEHMSVVLGLNYQQLIFNPALQTKLNLSLYTVASVYLGTYEAIGGGIIHSSHYPNSPAAIRDALNDLHQWPSLAVDIEGFSLKFNEAGIGTIAFAWDKHNGIAFACDYEDFDEPLAIPGEYGHFTPNDDVRHLLRNFFETYQGEIIFHKADYDICSIIAALWMDDLLDTDGLLKGLEIMTKRMHDTKIIAYLAINSTAGNVLGLKSLAHEFAGNWAKEDINDIRKIPLTELLQYNLVDALSTNYVKGKYYPIMVQDKQQTLYENLMLPSLKLIIQIELTGMPMKPSKITEVYNKLKLQQDTQLSLIVNSPLIKALKLVLQQAEMEKANAKLKTKQHPIEKFAGTEFNPNSGPQLQRLLYEQMGLPVIDLTDSKQPATGAETLEKLINHTNEPSYKELIGALIAYGKVSKILSTFLPAFFDGVMKADGMKYLHGSFNIGGTVSGRLSSSDPNMQNLPAGSEYGKTIKECFQAPPGWLFAGADFNSLEDYISALTTKDPNKLKVYIGHKVYELVIDGQNHHVRDDTIIEYDGKSMTAESFYETYRTF